MEENQVDQSPLALKIVFLLSFLLVTLDIFEIYFAYFHLKDSQLKIEPELFESCVKYHIISQMFFTMFATFAGFSACLMSLGLLIDYEFFALKVLDCFLYWNYLVFGPYLLASCILGYLNFSDVAFNCDPNDLTQKHINFSTVIALVLCLLLSLIITVGYSIFWSVKKLSNSIRYRRDGNRILGYIFWRYALNRNNQERNEEASGNRRRENDVELLNMNYVNLEENRNNPPSGSA
jgi:hypothetical protein